MQQLFQPNIVLLRRFYLPKTISIATSSVFCPQHNSSYLPALSSDSSHSEILNEQ